mgnify:CR=1 FL=1
MTEYLLFLLLPINIVLLASGLYPNILDKKKEAARIGTLYQSILNETQTGVIAHDIKTGEILFVNQKLYDKHLISEDMYSAAKETLIRQAG